MREIVGAFLSAEGGEERANSSVEPGDGALRDVAQVRLEFTESVFDGIKVWRILRQIAQRRSRGFDRFSYAGDFVSSKVIHHDHIFSPEYWHETLFNIGKEHFSRHRPVDHHRRHHFVVAQRGHESDGLPVPMRHVINQPHATGSATIESRHICADGRLVNKDQPGGVKQPLLSDPTPPRPSDVRPILFCRPQAFF